MAATNLTLTDADDYFRGYMALATRPDHDALARESAGSPLDVLATATRAILAANLDNNADAAGEAWSAMLDGCSATAAVRYVRDRLRYSAEAQAALRVMPGMAAWRAAREAGAPSAATGALRQVVRNDLRDALAVRVPPLALAAAVHNAWTRLLADPDAYVLDVLNDVEAETAIAARA